MQPLQFHIRWRGWDGLGREHPPPLLDRDLLADCEMRWEPPTDRLGWEQAALRPCSQVPVPCPWAFPGYSPRGCGKPTPGPSGARETAEGAAAGKSQGKGWRRPAVGSSAFPPEEPWVLTPQESELSKKRKKCQSLEQEARKKQRRCEELVSSGGPPEASSPTPRPARWWAPSPLHVYPSCPEEHAAAGILSWLMQAPAGGGRP